MIPGRRVVTLGDAVIDVIVETPPHLVTDDDVPSTVGLGVGGQAANVAAWCAHLGTAAAVISSVGHDAAGRLIRDSLAARGVEVLGPAPDGRSGVVVSLVGADGSRTLVSDRGTSAALGVADLREAWFVDVSWLHLSGYALFAAPPQTGPQHTGPHQTGAGDIGVVGLAAARLATAAGARVSVDLSAATLVAQIGAAQARRLIEGVGPEVVFGNEREVSAIGPLAVPVLVVKRGAAGCRIVTADGVNEVKAHASSVVRDTTGAGDAFAAGWLVGGIDAALEAARTCIGQSGAMPPGP